ncbi:unnamed protein product, partial [Iphiclides podalirius]
MNMNRKKRQRSENWLEEDKITLKDLVRERGHAIENKNTDTSTNATKVAAWNDLKESHSRPRRLGARALHSSPKARPKLAHAPKDRPAVHLRAKSVCLADRPRSQYVRSVHSADANRSRYPEKQSVRTRPPRAGAKRAPKPCEIVVRQQKRNVIDKVPLKLSIQNISIPTRYDRRSTSKHPQSTSTVDNKPKISDSKQVGESRRLCQTVDVSKGTENRLLLQISEAEQVADFERILNANAALWERDQGHVWRGSVAAHTPSASLLPRPRSTYSLQAASQAYHQLFQQHEQAVQPLVERYRRQPVDEPACPTPSFLGDNWYENLHDLSQFYEDDQDLQKEIETITDRLIADEVHVSESSHKRNRNFKVNLTDLIGLHVNGEGLSPPCRDERAPSPEPEALTAQGKEWLSPSMSTPDQRPTNDPDINVDRLINNLDAVRIDCDANVPRITFSNCCDGWPKGDTPGNSDVAVHLSVPSVDSTDESRPPL